MKSFWHRIFPLSLSLSFCLQKIRNSFSYIASWLLLYIAYTYLYIRRITLYMIDSTPHYISVATLHAHVSLLYWRSVTPILHVYIYIYGSFPFYIYLKFYNICIYIYRSLFLSSFSIFIYIYKQNIGMSRASSCVLFASITFLSRPWVRRPP